MRASLDTNVIIHLTCSIPSSDTEIPRFYAEFNKNAPRFYAKNEENIPRFYAKRFSKGLKYGVKQKRSPIRLLSYYRV